MVNAKLATARGAFDVLVPAIVANHDKCSMPEEAPPLTPVESHQIPVLSELREQRVFWNYFLEFFVMRGSV
jgi:hypothetical protein